jgi:hypothetical protein
MHRIPAQAAPLTRGSHGPSPRDFLDKLRKGTLTMPLQTVGIERESDTRDHHLEFGVSCHGADLQDPGFDQWMGV